MVRQLTYPIDSEASTAASLEPVNIVQWTIWMNGVNTFRPWIKLVSLCSMNRF